MVMESSSPPWRRPWQSWPLLTALPLPSHFVLQFPGSLKRSDLVFPFTCCSTCWVLPLHCGELLKNTEETLPYQGSKCCLHNLNYFLCMVVWSWYWNKAWKCIAGRGQNYGHLDLGVFSYSKVQLSSWSHQSFMLALGHFFTKLVQQTKSVEW